MFNETLPLSHQLFPITNVKCSVKVNKVVDLNRLFEDCQKLHMGFRSTRQPSFIVISLPEGSIRLIVFCNKKSTKFMHINITGITSDFELGIALKNITKILNCEESEISIPIIDNITAKSDILLHSMCEYGKTSINLRNLMNYIKSNLGKELIHLRYNPETYAALVIKALGTCVLVYSTGKVVVIGGKHYLNIKNLVNIINNSLCQHLASI